MRRSGSALRAHWDPALFTPQEYHFEEANVRSAFEAADKSELGTNVFQTSWHAKLLYEHDRSH
jgi:hypothetical protein